MKEKLNRFKLPIVLLLILLLGVGIRQGILLLRDHQAHKARAEAFDAALAQIDPENTAVSFRVPYDSRLFSPQNIGLGQLDGAARDALERLLASMVYDKEGTEESCFATENVLVSSAIEGGRLTISMGDDALCAVDITHDGEHWETAAYTYDLAARDDLLACGGLPAIAEMKDAIESDLQNQINDLGDSAKVDNKLK